MIEEIKEIKDMMKNEKQTISSMMNRGGGLHEKRESYGVYVDDFSGEMVNTQAVELARRSELKNFKDMNVYEYMRREEARSRGKVVGAQWMDSLKGTEVKSRLVAQEFASHQGDRDDILRRHRR